MKPECSLKKQSIFYFGRMKTMSNGENTDYSTSSFQDMGYRGVRNMVFFISGQCPHRREARGPGHLLVPLRSL